MTIEGKDERKFQSQITQGVKCSLIFRCLQSITANRVFMAERDKFETLKISDGICSTIQKHDPFLI